MGSESTPSFPISTTQNEGQIRATTRNPIRQAPEPSALHPKLKTLSLPLAREAEINLPAATRDPQTAETEIRSDPSPAS
jgi:hypothetical protein